MCTNFTGAWHGHHCDASIGLVCLDYGNPNPAPHGVTHFDNLVYAFITIFQCITMEGWASLMQSVIAGTSGWAFVYFFSLVRPAPDPDRNLSLSPNPNPNPDPNPDPNPEHGSLEREGDVRCSPQMSTLYGCRNPNPKVRVRIRASLTLTLWANLTHDHPG